MPAETAADERHEPMRIPDSIAFDDIPGNQLHLTLLFMSTLHLGLSHRGFCEAYSPDLLNLRLQHEGEISRAAVSDDYLPNSVHLVKQFAKKHFALGAPISLFVDSTVSQRSVLLCIPPLRTELIHAPSTDITVLQETAP